MDSSVCRFGDFIFTDGAFGISSLSQYCRYVTALSTVELGFDFRQVKRSLVQASTWTVGSTPTFLRNGYRSCSTADKSARGDADVYLSITQFNA